MFTNRGFTLLELFTALVIVAILAVTAYPLYSNHLVKTNRANAEVSLQHLAAKIEQYYLVHHSYQGATLAKLSSMQFSANNSYRLNIVTASEQSFSLQAIPQGQQAVKDIQCGTLSLDQTGKRSISGAGSVAACWH